YFFHLLTLTLKCKSITGLTINRKPVAGLKTKNCQLFSGRYTFSIAALFTTGIMRLTISVLKHWKNLTC
ncbi:MAG: hypothetical protein ACK4HE_12415, partial [Chitinophagaceae bacterium]